ncbi:MAG: response regulator transcription factor [Bacteroidales bacterium]|nr:response regulator transcription factor [Bacteroidales bacterium]
MASNGNVVLWCVSPVLQRNIRYFLRKNAYAVCCCHNLEEVHVALSIDDYLLIVTDIPYPDEAFSALCARHADLPVFHIVDQLPSQLPDPPHLLRKKPFDLSEIERMLQARQAPGEASALPLGNYTLLPESNRIRYRNTECGIPNKEMEMLLILYRNSPDIVSKEAIARKLWPQDPEGHENSIHVYLNNLRSYFQKDDRIRLLTVYGKGIRLERE